MLADWLTLPWALTALVTAGAAVLAALAAVLATPVYKHVLCAKYLFGGWKAVVPMVSALPAAVGVFLLILVFAIMDGFVHETRTAIRGTLSDVIVERGMGGIPHYDAFIKDIAQIDGVEAATPVVQTWGVVRIKPRFGGGQPIVRICQLWGIRPAGKARMGRFREYLAYVRATSIGEEMEGPTDVPSGKLLEVPARVERWRKSLGRRSRRGCVPGVALISGPMEAVKERDLPLAMTERAAAWTAAGVLGLAVLFVWRAARRRPGRGGWRLAFWGTAVLALAAVGVAVALQVRYSGRTRTVREKCIVEMPLVNPLGELVVTTVPIRPSGALEMEAGGIPKAETRAFVPVYTFRSRFYESDSRHLYVEFETAQAMAGLAARPAEGNRPAVPARASQVQVRLRDPSRTEAVCRRIRHAWTSFAARHPEAFPDGDVPHIVVQSWEKHVGPILGVTSMQRNITALMLAVMFIGFGVLIALISYVIAYIKSRDVGILKALGARDAGVGSLFLGYGFLIGLMGVALGMGGALLMLHYLDAIEVYVNLVGQDLSGNPEWAVFPKTVYYFDRIPRNVSPAWCVGVGLGVLALSTLASAAGGLLAALKQPVEALRYE